MRKAKRSAKAIKIICSLLLTVAVLLPFAVIESSAAVAPTLYTAAKATTAPVIDGTVDAIWASTEEIPFYTSTDCYVKILWTESGLYFLAYLPGRTSITFTVTERKWSYVGANYYNDGGGYAFQVASDGTVTNGLTHAYAAVGLNCKTSTITENGKTVFIVEGFAGKRATDGKCPLAEGSVIGFAARLDNGHRTNGAEWNFDSCFDGAAGSAEQIVGVTLVGNLDLSSSSAGTQTAAKKDFAAYAKDAPTVNCIKDAVYDSASALAIGSRGTAWAVWNEQGLYLFANVKGKYLDVCLSGKSFADTDTSSAWGTTAGDYYFSVAPDGTVGGVAVTDFSDLTGKKSVPDGLQVKTDLSRTFDHTSGTLSVYDVELFIPMSADEWNVGKADGNEIALGLFIDNSWMVYGCEVATYPRLTTSLTPLQLENRDIWLRGVQTTAVKDGKYDARLLAEISSLAFSQVGFEVSFTYQGNRYTQNLPTSVAYTSILADGKTLLPEKEGNYLVGVEVTDIPAGALDLKLHAYSKSGEAEFHGNSAKATVYAQFPAFYGISADSVSIGYGKENLSDAAKLLQDYLLARSGVCPAIGLSSGGNVRLTVDTTMEASAYAVSAARGILHIKGGSYIAVEEAVKKIVNDVLGDTATDFTGTSSIAPTMTDYRTGTKEELELVWHDEFDGDTLNSDYWQLYDRMFGGNTIVSTTSDKNIRVEDGKVIMRSWKEADGQYSTHTTLTSTGKISFLYGYIEISAKFDFKPSCFPSFWFQSAPEHRQADYMTEIDMFEPYFYGYMESGIHMWYLKEHESGFGGAYADYWCEPAKYSLDSQFKQFEYFSNYSGKTPTLTYAQQLWIRNWNSQYHTFGFGWTPTEFYYTVDGVRLGSHDISEDSALRWNLKNTTGNANDQNWTDFVASNPSPDNSGFRTDALFINFTNWVGGGFRYPSYGVADENGFPNTFEVDWIRLYQKSGEGVLNYDYK